MFQKLDSVEKRYEDLTIKISDPDIISKQDEWKNYMKEHAEIEPIVEKYREYKKVKQAIEDAKEMLEDPEMKELAEIDLLDNKDKLPKIEEELKILLIPKDPDDDKDVICEIRAGAGGEEAALFAGTLFRMYSMYAERKHWKLEIVNENETGIGGYKEISFMISGKGAYSRLKFESGVHRVQRVPVTETQGRVHTSTATVLVMPEAEELEVDLDMNDVRIDTFCASGPGGQCVNTTKSAIRVTHIPTGIVVSCQDGKSQHENKASALKVLRARLYDHMLQEKEALEGEERKAKIGHGDRSEKIRTYNYPQNRLTDHRIGYTVQQLDRIMEGKLDGVIEALISFEQKKALSVNNEE